MAKTKKRLSTEEKLYKAIQALFILHARQLDMGNKEIRGILGGDQADIDVVAKVVNKALKKAQKQQKK